MPVASEWLEFLVCPKCKKSLLSQSKNDFLICSSCELLYPIREGIPILLEGEALPIAKEK